MEFRLGEIEQLPVKDFSIDVIISNCVINLSPDKEQVFKEAYRVLKPGKTFSFRYCCCQKSTGEVETGPGLYIKLYWWSRACGEP